MKHPVLLPAPQKQYRLAGQFPAYPDRTLVLGQQRSEPIYALGCLLQQTLEPLQGPWTLSAAPLAEACVTLTVDPCQVSRPEGYRLMIQPRQIRIVSHDAAGAFYAVMTLRQLVRQFARSGYLPCQLIEDWPDFAHRGVMLDISRDKVPTLETLKGLVDRLSEWKINQLQLYTEHTFAYRRHQIVWQDASPLTGEEILQLDRYCRERFIELVPNQNSFGHMERWLKHPPYTHLAEAPQGFTDPWGQWRPHPSTLCPQEPGSLELIVELYDELLPHFSSPQFNIGGDEPFELGTGKSQALCAEQGTGRVYLGWLRQLHGLVDSHGKTMQFWGDIVLKHPELIPEIPPNAIALQWGYEANHPFAHESQLFAKAGIPYYVCPGTSTWNSIAGRTENALANLCNAARYGLRHGAIGYLNTDWGDNGHWQPLAVSLLPLACGAALSWAEQKNEGLDFAAALAIHGFRDPTEAMGRVAHELGNAYLQTGAPVFNGSILAHLLLYPERSFEQPGWQELDISHLQQTQTYIRQTMGALTEARPTCPDAMLCVKEFQLAADLLQHACQLGIERLQVKRHRITDIPARGRADLADHLSAILVSFRQLWLQRNRPGGVNDSAGRLQNLLQCYMAG